VVTVNVGDFLRLAASMEVHPGVIALREAGLSAEQQSCWPFSTGWKALTAVSPHSITGSCTTPGTRRPVVRPECSSLPTRRTVAPATTASPWARSSTIVAPQALDPRPALVRSETTAVSDQGLRLDPSQAC
jgi:hypothetical protein